jgi:hypothetical protein
MVWRLYVNNAKLGGLMLIYATALMMLRPFTEDIKMIAAPIPLIVALYILEKRGVLTVFAGMTLPALSICVGVSAFVITLNSSRSIPSAVVYAALGLLVCSLAFAFIRVLRVPVVQAGRREPR